MCFIFFYLRPDFCCSSIYYYCGGGSVAPAEDGRAQIKLPPILINELRKQNIFFYSCYYYCYCYCCVGRVI